MTNWPKILRDFLIEKGKAGEWTITNPDWQHVRWAYRVSRNYLVDPARRGASIIWTELRDTPPPRLETDYVQTAKTYVSVYCYARAYDDEEKYVDDAVNRAHNMRDQVASLVKLYTTQIPPAYRAIPSGETEFKSFEISPGFLAIVLVVEFEHDENALGAI